LSPTRRPWRPPPPRAKARATATTTAIAARGTATAAGARIIGIGTETAGAAAETGHATETARRTSKPVLDARPNGAARVRPTQEITMATRSAWLLAAAAAALVGVAVLARPAVPHTGSAVQGSTRQVSVSARRYAFEPARIEVQQDDLVKIRFTAEDIAHSFTVDQYRIAKRAGAGQTVTFEFRADQPGTFPYYCNLAIDDGCRKMKGELVVKPR
jgi:cytochrome c oxidase subunit 2